jgi:tRNA G18 (ribose-2'-O)-methylase SpoU
MPRIAIASLDDPRVAPYRQLKANNLLRGGELFVAEGTKLVERLLESDYETASVLISEKREAAWGPKVPADIPLYVIPQELGALLVGFNFHVGVMACGRRKPSLTLDDVLPATTAAPQTTDGGLRTIVVCPRCDNPENLGAIIRICRGFGVEAVLLGAGCCDPFSRRVLRVSMGAAFKQPIVESRDLAADLMRLRNEWGFELAATVLDPVAEPLSAASRTDRLALLFGNEHSGLSAEWVGLCHRRLTIPMSGDADSLNVAVAAGIFLHHFTRVQPHA